MRILFVASEMAPLAKVGGLGDVIGSLPKALAKIGVHGTVVIPRYEMIPRDSLTLLGDLSHGTMLYQTLAGEVEVILIENDAHLSRGPVYSTADTPMDHKAELDRFVFFSQSVAELLRNGILTPDIIHCHDWHTGALVQELAKSEERRAKGTPKVVFTIHNLANQGIQGMTNWMAEGIKNADMVTTVSPTYAKEILTPEYGEKLEPLLKKRSAEGNLIGILNGIDYDFWDPETDPYLKERYNERSIAKRAVNKRALVAELGLASPALPILGLVARLTPQKGIDMIIEAVPAYVKDNAAQFVFLGKGIAQYEKALQELARAYPAHVAVRFDFDEPLAHRIYAGTDFFLMPSRFEPCGLGQMVSMRYGTPPIVRDTGGLHDSVAHLLTGFVFKEATTHALEETMNLALQYYKEKPQELKVMQERCMAAQFDFSRSAEEYKKVYEKLIASN